MATDKPFVMVSGVVQRFKGEESALKRREWNGVEYRDFTVKTSTTDSKTGKARRVKISLYPEFEEVDIQEGGFVVAEGTLTVNPGKEGNGDFYNLNAKTLVYVAPIFRASREVVNEPASTPVEETTTETF